MGALCAGRDKPDLSRNLAGDLKIYDEPRIWRTFSKVAAHAQTTTDIKERDEKLREWLQSELGFENEILFKDDEYDLHGLLGTRNTLENIIKAKDVTKPEVDLLQKEREAEEAAIAARKEQERLLEDAQEHASALDKEEAEAKKKEMEEQALKIEKIKQEKAMKAVQEQKEVDELSPRSNYRYILATMYNMSMSEALEKVKMEKEQEIIEANEVKRQQEEALREYMRAQNFEPIDMAEELQQAQRDIEVMALEKAERKKNRKKKRRHMNAQQLLAKFVYKTDQVKKDSREGDSSADYKNDNNDDNANKKTRSTKSRSNWDEAREGVDESEYQGDDAEAKKRREARKEQERQAQLLQKQMESAAKSGQKKKVESDSDSESEEDVLLTHVKPKGGSQTGPTVEGVKTIGLSEFRFWEEKAVEDYGRNWIPVKTEKEQNRYMVSKINIGSYTEDGTPQAIASTAKAHSVNNQLFAFRAEIFIPRAHSGDVFESLHDTNVREQWDPSYKQSKVAHKFTGMPFFQDVWYTRAEDTCMMSLLPGRETVTLRGVVKYKNAAMLLKYRRLKEAIPSKLLSKCISDNNVERPLISDNFAESTCYSVVSRSVDHKSIEPDDKMTRAWFQGGMLVYETPIEELDEDVDMLNDDISKGEKGTYIVCIICLDPKSPDKTVTQGLLRDAPVRVVDWCKALCQFHRKQRE